MSDLDDLRDLLARFGLTPEEQRGGDRPGEHCLCLTVPPGTARQHPRVNGYGRFYAAFWFTAAGDFTHVEIAE